MVVSVKPLDLGPLETFVQALDQDLAQGLLEDIGEAARQRWIVAANERLNSTRAAYIAGIEPVSIENGRAVLKLVGDLPNMIEGGADPFSMHETLLKEGDPNVSETIEGIRYRNVPFRHKTASSGFATPGTPAGRQFIFQAGAKGAKKIGNRVMRAARKLPPGQPLGAGLAPTLRTQRGPKTHHSTDIFQGMLKVRQQGRKNAQYYTWRRISTNTKGGSSWLHPGIQPRNLLDIVIQDIDAISESIVDGFLSGILVSNK